MHECMQVEKMVIAILSESEVQLTDDVIKAILDQVWTPMLFYYIVKTFFSYHFVIFIHVVNLLWCFVMAWHLPKYLV